MAPQKSQLKKGARPLPAKRGAQKPAPSEVAAPIVSSKSTLTRAERSARNKAEYKAIRRQLVPNPTSPKVIHGDVPKPVAYDKALGEKICFMFASDPHMSLMRLNADPEMPTVWHFYAWLRESPELDKAYTLAREIQADLKADGLQQLCSDPLLGTVTIRKTGGINGDVTETKEYDNVERAKLIVSTSQWLLAKTRPKKYGTQPIAIESSGTDALGELLDQFRQRSKALENGS